jgi:hypothetical protein
MQDPIIDIMSSKPLLVAEDPTALTGSDTALSVMSRPSRYRVAAALLGP